MADTSLTISCEECTFDGTSMCSDCVVSFLLARDPEDALVIDADEFRAVKLLESAGLVPGLRHRRRVS
jgi:hypothetical protein